MDGIASLKASSLLTRLREAQWDVIEMAEKARRDISWNTMDVPNFMEQYYA
jgi:hypothetical protein